MTELVAVSDSSPIISLARIERLGILSNLFPTVVVPPAVAREVGAATLLMSRAHERRLSREINRSVVAASLAAGETEAIGLALEMSPCWILLDERAARRQAQSLGLRIMGTLGLLLTAKDRGLVPAVRPLVDALMRAGFRVSKALYDRVLRDAAES